MSFCYIPFRKLFLEYQNRKKIERLEMKRKQRESSREIILDYLEHAEIGNKKKESVRHRILEREDRKQYSYLMFMA